MVNLMADAEKSDATLTKRQRGTMRNGSYDILLKMRQLANEIILKTAEQEGADIIPRDFAALLDKADEVFNANNVLMALDLMEGWRRVAIETRSDAMFIAGFENGYKVGLAGEARQSPERIKELLPEALFEAWPYANPLNE